MANVEVGDEIVEISGVKKPRFRDLMSNVSLSSEFEALDRAFGIGLGEMEWLTTNAVKSAFVPFDERLRLIGEVVKPGYAHLRARESAVVVPSD